MNLVERLEKLATKFDRQRWCDPIHRTYDVDAADNCDLLREVGKELKKHERTH